MGPACLKPGWNRAAYANVMPTSSRTLATRSGEIVRSTPSAASTSDEPANELAALLPCLTTRAPAAAATTDAMVETLTVPNRSPPVPTMSSAIGSTASGCAFASTASRKPTISPTVSPFARRATRKAPSWAPVARPAITSSIAQEASAIDRSDPARSWVSRADQLSSDGMASIVPSADIGHNGTVTSTTISRPQSSVINRPNVTQVGVIVWLGSEVMFFAGLFAVYFTLRNFSPELWADQSREAQRRRTPP